MVPSATESSILRVRHFTDGVLRRKLSDFRANGLSECQLKAGHRDDCLPPERSTMLKTTLAERILKSAAQGDRDRERLLDAALRDTLAGEARRAWLPLYAAVQ